MRVNEDPQLARLQARLLELSTALRLSIVTLERGPEISMGERERVLERLRAAV